MTAFLNIDNVSFAYPDGRRVCESLSFSVEEGEIGCLLGPSGCGKTTMLRLIAGFEKPDAGEVRLRGKLLADAGTSLPPEARNVGVVFQDYALFPHLSVEKNIAFGLRGMDDSSAKKRVQEMLDLVQLTTESHKYPHEISGGQRQRVALARALAPRPALLLLDEPFPIWISICASGSAWKCGHCCARCRRPRCWSHTISTRHFPSPTKSA